MKKTACLIVNGVIKDFEFHKKIIESCQYVVAADGASNNLLRIGVVPDCIIGDMDSIKKEVWEYYKTQDVEFLTFPAKKDKTDSELAIDYLHQKGVEEVIMLGSLGNRMDHTLGNLFLIYYGDRLGIKITVIDEKNKVNLIKEGITQIEATKGDIISFLNLGSITKGIFLKGVEYPLENFDLILGSTRCISNLAVEDKPEIEIREGHLLGFVTKE